jgi:hypothetical protein
LLHLDVGESSSVASMAGGLGFLPGGGGVVRFYGGGERRDKLGVGVGGGKNRSEPFSV